MADLIAGLLNINDSDRTYINTVGQNVIYDAVQEIFNQWNANLTAMLGQFVSETTELHKEKIHLIQGGRLQRQGGQAPAGATKQAGSWEVGYPIEQYGTAYGWVDVDLAYFKVKELDKHITGIMAQGVNTLRFEILKTLMNNVQVTGFDDKINPVFNIVPLANGDAVVYPPVPGTEDGATDDHYLASGYIASAISDTNDPYPTIVQELAEHYGGVEEELEIVVFIHRDQQALTEALTDFTGIDDMHITPGDDQNRVSGGVPNVPGKVIGRHSDGTWVSRWDWMPTGYLMGIALGAEAPLKMRVDLSETGLPQGLGLVRGTDATFPLYGAQYRHRFGLGVSNRMNGVVMELTAGSYTIPTIYA